MSLETPPTDKKTKLTFSIWLQLNKIHLHSRFYAILNKKEKKRQRIKQPDPQALSTPTFLAVLSLTTYKMNANVTPLPGIKPPLYSSPATWTLSGGAQGGRARYAAACPRKLGRNSPAHASSSRHHLCNEKARKMKCQLLLSRSINVAFIW